jgi:hypothetical protein
MGFYLVATDQVDGCSGKKQQNFIPSLSIV